MIFGLLSLLMVVATISFPLSTLLNDFVAGMPLSADGIAAQFDDPDLRQAFINTALITLASCMLAMLAAIPLTVAVIRSVHGYGALGLLLMALPFVVPAFATAAIAGPLLGPIATHIIDGIALDVLPDPRAVQLALLYALHYFPLIVGALLFRLDRTDRDQADAARSLGAGRWTLWSRITMPLALPGLVLGSCLMGLRVVADGATPALLGKRDMLAPLLLDRLGDPTSTMFAPTALLIIAISVVIIVLGWNSLRPSPVSGADEVTRSRQGTGLRSGMSRVLALPLLALGIAFALLPIAALLATVMGNSLMPVSAPVSLAGPHPVEPLLPALQQTLIVAATSGIGLVCGAWLLLPLARHKGTLGMSTRGLITIALAVPPLALAAAWWHGTAHWLPAGAAINLAWALLAVIAIVQTLPLGLYMIERRRNTLADALLASDSTLATRRRVRRATLASGNPALPLIGVFLIGATTLLVELNAALALPQLGDRHVASRIYSSIPDGGDWAFSLMLLVLLSLGSVILAISAWYDRRTTSTTRVSNDAWQGEPG